MGRMLRTDAQSWALRYEAKCAQLEARFGVKYEQLPEALRHLPPEHPARTVARRFDNHAGRALPRFGWRTQRAFYLARLERFRQAEIEFRQQRFREKHPGRTRSRNPCTHREKLLRFEKQELQQGLW